MATSVNAVTAPMPPTTVPVGSGAAPTTDLATILAQLQVVVGQLQGIVQAMTAQASGGGSTVVGGGVPGQSPAQVPMQQAPVQQAPAGMCGCMAGATQGATQVGQQTPPEQAPPQQAPAPAPAPAPPAPAPGGGDVRQKIVQITNAELAKGVTEDAGSNKDSRGNIVKYRSAVTSPGEDPDAAEPWCADFASWVMREAGVPIGEGGRGQDYVNYLKSWGEKEGRYGKRGDYAPQPGDMVIYDWEGDGNLDHVGIVTAVNGNDITTVGGNEGDAVKQAERTLGDSNIVGFVKAA